MGRDGGREAGRGREKEGEERKGEERTRSLVVSIVQSRHTLLRKVPGESFVWSSLSLPRWLLTIEDSQGDFFGQGGLSLNFLFSYFMLSFLLSRHCSQAF